MLINKEASYDKVTSHISDDRFKSLSKIANTLLTKIKDECEYILWIESDLIFDENLFKNLYNGIIETKSAIIAPIPIITIREQQRLYDIWAFRNINGINLSRHYDFSESKSKYVELSSVGTCAIINAEYVRKGCDFGEGCFPELCRQIREIGGKILVDTTTYVEHPGNKFVCGRWI
jgi:GT2 family glycosyltransferase